MSLSNHARLEAFSLARSATDAELIDLMRADAARYVEIYRETPFLDPRKDEPSGRLEIFASEAAKRDDLTDTTEERHEAIATRLDVLQYSHNARWPEAGDAIHPSSAERAEFDRLMDEFFALEELRPDLAAARGALAAFRDDEPF